MAERPIRVLFQASYGSTYRRLSPAELKSAQDTEGSLARKWAEAGVRYIGYFGVPCGADADEYSHTTILELKDFSQAQQMSDDIWQSDWAKYVDKWSLTIGWGNSDLDDFWRSIGAF